MKIQLLLVFTVLISFSLQGQPVFTQDWGPTPGHVSTNKITTEVPDIGGIGEDQMWDFSGVMPDPGFPAVTFTYVDIATAPDAALFPDATIAAELQVGTFFGGHGYYLLDEESFQTLGNAGSYNTTIYDDTQKGLCFPFEYEDSFEDTYAWVTDNGYFTSYLNATSVNTYNAYGTLVLPNGTFENVARYEQIREERDSFSIGGALEIVTVTFDTTIGWINLDHASQLCLLNRVRTISLESFPGQMPDTTDNVYDVTFSFDDLAVPSMPPNSNFEANSDGAIQLFPNPAQDYLMVEGLREWQGKEILIVNTHGEVLKRQTGVNTVDLKGLAPGVYWLQVEGNPVSPQKFIKQ